MESPERKLPLNKGVGAPRTYEPPTCPITDQNGPSGFKTRLAEYISHLPEDHVIEYVRTWLPGEQRFAVDWREQNKRIANGETYELCITIARRR